jgi:hypothetical protein
MTKKYFLKPGKHQFIAGSPAIHDNDNLTDEEAEWYLEKYPHIAILFERIPTDNNEQNSCMELIGEDPVFNYVKGKRGETIRIQGDERELAKSEQQSVKS